MVPDPVVDRRDAEGRMITTVDRVLEVSREHPPFAIDAEEVVRVFVVALGLGHAFGDERHRDDAAAARGGGRARAVSPEPGLDRKRARAEQRRRTKRDAIVKPVEMQRVVGGIDRRRHHAPAGATIADPIEDARFAREEWLF